MKKILVMTDFSKAAKNAALSALDMALHFHAEILLLHSYHWPQVIFFDPPLMDYKGIEKKADARLEKEKKRLSAIMPPKKARINIRTINTLAPLSEVLYDIQQSGEIILVVMGMHKGHKSSFLFGNHVHIALRNSNCPLLIVPNSGLQIDCCKITFASNLDKNDLLLLKALQGMAKVFHAGISVRYVMARTALVADFNEEDHIAAFSNALSATDELGGIGFRVLEGHSVSQAIEGDSTRSAARLLVIVNRDHGLLHELFSASHCHELLKTHLGSILVLPGGWAPACG